MTYTESSIKYKICKSVFFKTPQLINVQYPRRCFLSRSPVAHRQTAVTEQQLLGCEWIVSFTASWEKKVYCRNLNLGWETNKWILKSFLEAGLYGIVTELMDVVSFAACFSYFGCCDSHVLFSKAVAIQSVCQNWACNYDAVLHCFTISCFSDCSLLLLYGFSYLSCWPEKTSTRKDRHQKQCFCTSFHHPSQHWLCTALGTLHVQWLLWVSGVTENQPILLHRQKELAWARWVPKSIISPLTIMQIIRAHLRQAAATSSGCVPTWHMLARIPVIARERGLWCPFSVSAACGCWTVKVKDSEAQSSGASEDGVKWE